MPSFRQLCSAALLTAACFIPCNAAAQSAGNSGSIMGTVTDPSDAVIPNATVKISNPVSGFDRSTQTDSSGKFEFTNIPFHPYHLQVQAEGFAPYAQDVEP